MITAIIGSRNFTDYEFARDHLIKYDISAIVSGGAVGADKIAEIYAKEFSIPIMIYLPDWEKYKKAAGMIRNSLIIDNSERVIAFWDGNSNGTRDSISKARKANKELIIISTNSLVSFF